MRKIDLGLLKEYQEIPKIDLKPIKVLDDRIYYVKIIKNSKDEEWVDGIYCYDIEDNISERVDTGVHSEYPYKYDVFVAYTEEDVRICDNMNYIFYSIVVDSEEEGISKIVLYAIDIITHEQIALFVLKYSQKEFYYMGFRLLSNRYIAIDLVNAFNDEIKEYDKLFILDIYTKEIIEIHDLSIKYSLGMFQLSRSNKYIFCEEIYMSEEDEVDILTSDMYEVDEDDLAQNKLNIFNNSIKYMDFENFKAECRKLNEEIAMTKLDYFLEDGIIRVIGTTEDYIYYKKSKHQKYLESSKDFADRIMIGKEEIYSINKNALSINHITNLEFGSTFSFEDSIFYKINETKDNIIVISIDTGEKIYDYKKQEKIEELIDFVKNRYLIVSIKANALNEKYLKIIDILEDKIELCAQNVIIIGDTIFYENLILNSIKKTS